MEYQDYIVTVRFADGGAWDEKRGIEYRVSAQTKAAANKQVRRMAYNDGHTVGRRATFSAKLENA